jgi:CBS-domain-containing membrane protein
MMLKKELSHAARHHDVRTYAVKVADIMATKVVTVGPETPYHEIVALLLDHDISGLPVVDADGRVLGIVSEADLITKEAFEDPSEGRTRHLGVIRDHIMGRDTEWIRKSAARNARELMTSPVQTVSPTDDLAAAARLMLSKHLKRLPVIDDDGRLVGIVARHDLLRPFARTDGEIAEEVAALLADPMRTPDGHRVTFSVREGVVLLNGTTRFPSDVHVIVAFVSAIPGVVAVGDGISPRHDEPRVEPTFTVGATEH